MDVRSSALLSRVLLYSGSAVGLALLQFLACPGNSSSLRECSFRPRDWNSAVKSGRSPLNRAYSQIGQRFAHHLAEEIKTTMKYLIAWVLGVPGGLILLWFLFNHMH